MAFSKTGDALTQPEEVHVPRVGEEKDGRVWDGERWVSKAEWEKQQASEDPTEES